MSVGSLFEVIEAEEGEVRGRVEQLQVQLAELTERVEAERERLSRLVITRETVGELLARTTDDSAVDEPVSSPGDGSPFAGAERQVVGAERQVVGVLSVPKWQPGIETSAPERLAGSEDFEPGGLPGPGREGFGAPAGDPVFACRFLNSLRTRAGVSLFASVGFSQGRRKSVASGRASRRGVHEWGGRAATRGSEDRSPYG